MIIYLFLIALSLAVVRFMIPTHSLSLGGSYEAIAHLFVGGLIGIWLHSKDKFGEDKWYGFVALLLTIIEVVAFFSRR